VSSSRGSHIRAAFTNRFAEFGTLRHFAALHKLVAIAVIADIDQAAKQSIAHMEKEWIASVFAG
jgi:hypothetical protein